MKRVEILYVLVLCCLFARGDQDTNEPFEVIYEKVNTVELARVSLMRLIKATVSFTNARMVSRVGICIAHICMFSTLLSNVLLFF